jgi:hypothetical protein
LRDLENVIETSKCHLFRIHIGEHQEARLFPAEKLKTFLSMELQLRAIALEKCIIARIQDGMVDHEPLSSGNSSEFVGIPIQFASRRNRQFWIHEM